MYLQIDHSGVEIITSVTIHQSDCFVTEVMPSLHCLWGGALYKHKSEVKAQQKRVHIKFCMWLMDCLCGAHITLLVNFICSSYNN